MTKQKKSITLTSNYITILNAGDNKEYLKLLDNNKSVVNLWANGNFFAPTNVSKTMLSGYYLSYRNTLNKLVVDNETITQNTLLTETLKE
jgi:hypothetical protein